MGEKESLYTDRAPETSNQQGVDHIHSPLQKCRFDANKKNARHIFMNE